MSRTTRQSSKACLELGESWGDVDYEDGEQSSESESPSASDSESDVEEEKVAKQASKVNASRNSPPRGSSSQQTRQQMSLPTSIRLRSQISTPPSITKSGRSRTTRKTPEVMEPSFVMPSPSTQPQNMDRSRSLGTPSNMGQQNSQYRRLSRQGSAPIDPSLSTTYEFVDESLEEVSLASPVQQGAKRRRPRKDQCRSQRPATTTQTKHRQSVSRKSSNTSYVATIWDNFLGPAVTYILSIMTDALQLLRPIFKYVLLALLLHFLLWKGKNAVDSIVRTAFYPICSFPGASYLSLPFCPSQQAWTPGRERFDGMVEAQTRFEEIVEYSRQVADLRQQVRTQELAMRDLRSVVGFSNLASKQEMGNILNYFIATSKASATDLGKWDSKLNFALDRIIVLNEHTLRTMESPDFRDDGLDWPQRFFFSLGLATRPKTREDELHDTYNRQASGLEDEVKELLRRADYILKDLDGMEMQYNRFVDLVAGEEISTKEQRDQVFGRLYSKLGGNRKEKSRIDKNLQILDGINNDRHRTYTLLSNVLSRLRDILSYLENLREELGRPQEDGFREIPLEMHLGSIRKSVERLDNLREQKKQDDRQVHSRLFPQDEDATITRTVQEIGA